MEVGPNWTRDCDNDGDVRTVFDTIIAEIKQRQHVCHILCLGRYFIGLDILGVLAYGKVQYIDTYTTITRFVIMRLFFSERTKQYYSTKY